MRVTGRAIRRIVLDASKRAGVGHIGSALSVAEILAVLHDGGLRGEPGDPDRDRFVLSKGHAALALYAALRLRGRLDDDDLGRFLADGSALAVHPDHRLPGIDFSTGSLGHGLSIAAGAALAGRLQGSRRRAFALLSDAELDEGSTWEAVMFAAHNRLSALVAIVDANGQQAFGYTRDVLDLSPISGRFCAFGWEAREVDGHDEAALRAAIAGLDDDECGPPRVLVARTTFGKGVSFMEGRIEWGYRPMSDEDYRRALAEIEA